MMNHKILYVEDNPLNLKLVRKILNAAGYEMIEAVDGYSGLIAAAREQPDLILMDVNLPDIDGLAVTAQLKSQSNTRHIPVIALTANSMHGDRERCMACGCNDYIPKPVAKSELLTAIAQLMPVGV